MACNQPTTRVPVIPGCQDCEDSTCPEITASDFSAGLGGTECSTSLGITGMTTQQGFNAIVAQYLCTQLNALSTSFITPTCTEGQEYINIVITKNGFTVEEIDGPLTEQEFRDHLRDTYGFWQTTDTGNPMCIRDFYVWAATWDCSG